MIAKAQTLKRKLEAFHTEETQLHRQSRARLQHLQDLHDIPSLADVKYDEWSKVRLDRMLVDYLLRMGYTDSARQLAKEKGIDELVDIEAFMQCGSIERSLRHGRTQECLQWCGENKQALKKMNVRQGMGFGYGEMLTFMNRAVWSWSYGYSSLSSLQGVGTCRSLLRRLYMRRSIWVHSKIRNLAFVLEACSPTLRIP